MESNELSHLAYHLDMLGVVPLKKVEEEKKLPRTYEFKRVKLDENGEPPW